MTAFVKGLVLLCVSFGFAAHAGEALDTINAQVESQAEQIDQNHGVLLDTQERQNLKMALIVKKVVAAASAEKSKTVKEITDAAVNTYEITDPVEQRKLLIEVSAQKSTGTSGNEPP